MPKEDGKGGSKIFLDNFDVLFKIEMDDVATLRAIINSSLRLADTSYRCLIKSQK
jgi:tRNA threonylcarbamoyladenosine modification (KEOPS) complex  Pcc1 subunit